MNDDHDDGSEVDTFVPLIPGILQVQILIDTSFVFEYLINVENDGDENNESRFVKFAIASRRSSQGIRTSSRTFEHPG